jgi:predicted DsbA family dithiol-disulfide isomerase
MKIDFVSDVVCPWCAVGLHGLEIALQRLAGELSVDLHFQPFELHPQMGPEGQDLESYLTQKYGVTPEQSAATRETIRQRGADVGFRFELDKRTRTWNTFDAHRLLHQAGLEGRQRELKHALLSAYFTEGLNPGDPAVLRAAAASAGMDAGAAQRVIEGGLHADAVRAAERHFQSLGIRSVPAVIVDDRHLISGGQPPAVYEQALRQIAAQAA